MNFINFQFALDTEEVMVVNPVSTEAGFDGTVDGRYSTSNVAYSTFPRLRSLELQALESMIITLDPEECDSIANAPRSCGAICLNARNNKESQVYIIGACDEANILNRPVICNGEIRGKADFSATGGQTIVFEATLYDEIAITGISAANPAVVTAADHKLTNGETVLIRSVVGNMGDDVVNGNTYVVAGRTQDTYQLTGCDTSGKTYTSGGIGNVVRTLGGVTILNPEYTTITGNADLKLTVRASIVLVEANPGSYYYDAATNLLYISLPGSDTDYFTNGGGVAAMFAYQTVSGAYQLAEYSVEATYSNTIIIENCKIVGGVQASKGGRIMLRNCQIFGATDRALYVLDGGQIFGENIEIAYTQGDAASIKAVGSIELDGVIFNHIGTGSSDQAITGHEGATFRARNITINDGSGPAIQMVDGSRLFLENFTINNCDYGIVLEDNVSFIGERGLIANCTNDGFKTVAAAGVVWSHGALATLRDVDFSNNGTDINVPTGTEITTLLHNCRYGSISGANNDFTEVDTKGSADLDTVKAVTNKLDTMIEVIP